jgi:hypothetical protein
MKWLVILCLLFTTPVLAQQPQQQTPSQIAIQLSNIIGQWAQAIETLQTKNAELQKQLDAVTKERDELQAKLPKPPTQ